MKEILSDEDIVKFGVPDPSALLPETITKADVLRWEVELKQALRRILESPNSAFQDIRKSLELLSGQDASPPFDQDAGIVQTTEGLFNLVVDLHNQDALPALVFHYDTHGCEVLVKLMLMRLAQAEKKWKTNSPEWAQKLDDFEAWKRAEISKQKKKIVIQRQKGDDSSRVSKLDLMREEASVEVSHWASFDPRAPLERFSFADVTKMQMSEAMDMIESLQGQVNPWLLDGLQRGLGVHHSSLNREYRQT